MRIKFRQKNGKIDSITIIYGFNHIRYKTFTENGFIRAVQKYLLHGNNDWVCFLKKYLIYKQLLKKTNKKHKKA